MGYHMTCYGKFVGIAKVQRGTIEKSEKLEGKSCENNVRNSEEHIVSTQILRSTVRSAKPPPTQEPL